MAWTTLTLEVTTPLFNGGAGTAGGGRGSVTYPADDTGVRVPSLRGAMRFWFRALAGIVTGPDLRLLADLERRVFGGINARDAAGPGPNGTGARSRDDSITGPVRLRIPRQPPLTRPEDRHDFLPRPRVSRAEREGHPGYWIVYLLGQGLANLRDCSLTRPYVAPGQTFELKLRSDGDDRAYALTLAALWLTCAYGGVGARTRRGFGGLRIVDASGTLPQPWTPDSIRTPALDHYEGLSRLWPAGPIGGCMRHLVDMVQEVGKQVALDAWPEPPRFPVMSKRYTRAGVSGGEPFRDWADVASHAGEQFRRFRASEEHPEAERRYWPPLKTPEWNSVVWGEDTRFPLGALGLPVIYKDRYAVNAESQGEPLRRASALWLRPVGTENGWRLLSFAFLGEFLPGPDAPQVRLRGPDRTRTLQVTRDDVAVLADAWIERLTQDEWRWFGHGDRPSGRASK